MAIVYKYTAPHHGYFAGDTSACDTLEEFEEMKSNGHPIKKVRVTTDATSSASKSDPDTREKLREGASNTSSETTRGDDSQTDADDEDDEYDLVDRLPDHHMSLRKMAEKVADAIGEEPPKAQDTETSRRYLLSHPEETESLL